MPIKVNSDLSYAVDALLPAAEGNPRAMIRLAQLLLDDGYENRALELCSRARVLANGDAEIISLSDGILSESVPDWHFRIVRDETRNAAYDAALRRAVSIGSRVLEIGTGTALLALMAARAGSEHVVTCEKNPVIAGLAEEIVKRNGYASQVRVIAKHSEELELEKDLGGHADILVSEIISNNMLGQGILAAHEGAVRDLLKPGGRVIPASGSLRVALGEDLDEEAKCLAVVDGFDLTPFNRLLMGVRQVSDHNGRLQLRSEAADLFTFDFASDKYCAPARQSVVCRSTGGRVSGVVQWIALRMDGVTTYENRPETNSCWAVLFYPFPSAIQTMPGQEIRIFGSHDRRNISIWTEPV